jgi:Putative beta-barrel porin-2, OmpL-like. bbp2
MAFIVIVITMLSLVAAPVVVLAQTAEMASAPAELSPIAWQYGGFIDVGYLRDFNDPSNHLFRSRGTAFHVDEWDLNMAGAYVKKKASEQSRWGTELLVQEGKDEEVFGFSATAPNLAGAEWLGHLGLANVSYLAPVGTGLTVQGGIFASFIGYDSLYAKDNFNYTRPWGADFTPYLMTGVNVSYTVTDKTTATAFVVNGYWHLADANSVPSSGGQLAYKVSPRLTVKETMMSGPHQANTELRFWRFLSDSIVELKSGRAVGAFEYQLSTERVDALGDPRAWWMSAQLPLHLSVHGPFSVSVRPEIAWDSTGRWTSHEQSIRAVTTTLEYRAPYRWANTILRLEHRFDDSRGKDGGFFTDGESSTGVVGLKPTQQLLVLGLIFTFDSPSQR